MEGKGFARWGRWVARKKRNAGNGETPGAGEPVEATSDFDDSLPNLPWLNAVEEDDEARPPRRAGLGIAAFTGIALLLLVSIYFLVSPQMERRDGADLAAPEAAQVQPVEPVEAPVSQAPPRTATPPPEPRSAAAAGPTIQLASFYSRERADRYWQRLEKSHRSVAKLDHAIVEGSFKGRSVHRVRATGPGADRTCDELRQARVPCLRIGA
jgi:hypothetical protein